MLALSMGRCRHGRLNIVSGPVPLATWIVARTIAYPIRFFFPPSSDERSGRKILARARHVRPYGTGGLAECCKNICVPYPIFFREIARLSIQQPGGTQCLRCYDVGYGSTPRRGLSCRSGWSRAFPTTSWQANPSRYRFDRRNVFLA